MSKREPSIHITYSRLRDIMRLHFDYDDNADDMIEDLISYIQQEAPKYTLEKRSINIKSQSVAKKVLNKVTNDKTDINLLAELILSVRINLKHKGVKPVDNNSSEWSSLKKLVPVINQYCNDFGLKKRKGYIDYITIGLNKITSFRGYLTKLYDMSESISLEKEALMFIEDDDTKGLTKEIHDYYVFLINKRTGTAESFKHNPIKYAKFIKVKELVKKLKTDYRTYIDSQFAQLEWTSSYPEPDQLINDKAIERYNKHIYTTKGKNKKENKADSSLTNVLKNIKKKK